MQPRGAPLLGASLARWLVAYELMWLLVMLATALTGIHHGCQVASASSTRPSGPVYHVLAKRLSGWSFFLMGGTLVILHPLLGLLAVAIMALSDGVLASSWLSGCCPLARLAHGLLGSQAYPLLWILVVRIYLVQRRRLSLLQR